MAYSTDESGTSQVVMQPFPDRGNGKWQVSARGGAMPRWARGGKELYYMDLAGSIVRVAITADPAFEVGKATSLSPMVPDGEVLSRTNQVMAATVVDQWDVTGDGQRALRGLVEKR